MAISAFMKTQLISCRLSKADGALLRAPLFHHLCCFVSFSSGGSVSARESLCRGLGSRWFTERFHRNALVTHFQHGQVCCTARRLENYAITRCRLHQRAPQRRHPTDVVAVEIDLVCAHDAHHSLRCRGIGIAHSRSEECPRRRLPRSRSFRVNHFRRLDSLREKANPSIDLAQPPLAVLIVSVFTAIAVARSPRHHLCHGRAFPGEQKPVLIFEALQAAWRYVVVAWRRGLVPLRFSCKTFSHILDLPARIQWVPQSSQDVDSAMPVHTLSPRFCPEIAQALSTNEIGATPQESLPTTRRFPVKPRDWIFARRKP